MIERRALALCAAALAPAFAAAPSVAQTVALSGTLGQQALLVIDGKPRNLAVGAAAGGVKLVGLNPAGAVVEIKGQRVSLALGGAPVNLGGAAGGAGTARQIVLSAEMGGHFYASGQVNGKAVRFVVDTGATNVAMSQEEADRLGVDYKSGTRGLTRTANGTVPIWRTQLTSVRVGDVVVYNVDASVLPGPMSHVLLGNSFLGRFQMRRDNDTLTLDLRY